MHTKSDIRPLHRVAVLASIDIVSSVTRDDLDRPTPCAGWNLLDLLTHMTVQHYGFAAAAEGHGGDLRIWEPTSRADAVAADPVGSYAGAATAVLSAFSPEDAPDRSFELPELGPGAIFPGAMAIGFHFVDYLVHGWDVARTIDVTFDPAADVVAAVLPLTLAVPDGDFRTIANTPFAPAIAPTDTATDLDRILLHLGRSPEWAPPPRG